MASLIHPHTCTQVHPPIQCGVCANSHGSHITAAITDILEDGRVIRTVTVNSSPSFSLSLCVCFASIPAIVIHGIKKGIRVHFRLHGFMRALRAWHVCVCTSYWISGQTRFATINGHSRTYIEFQLRIIKYTIRTHVTWCSKWLALGCHAKPPTKPIASSFTSLCVCVCAVVIVKMREAQFILLR